MQAFVNQGHHVFMLSQMEKGAYHIACENIGVQCFYYVLKKTFSPVYFLNHAIFLKRFCKKHSIDVVYAHLENAGLPAVLCQYFIPAKVFTCRHIVDEAELMGSKKFKWLNKIVYTLSKNIIVVSERSKQWMIEKEGVSEKKISVIRLAYNFALYPKADIKIVEEIRQQYPARMLLLTACRMMEGKRPQVSINVAKRLIEDGLDVKLLLLGEGPLANNIIKEITIPALESRVYFLGFRSNIMDYLSACDILIHPSLQDSSSVIIKEAGLNERAVLACFDIGDASEYLVHQKNALLVTSTTTEKEMTEHIKAVYAFPEQLIALGKNLKTSVLERFDISNILPEYNRIHLEIEQHGKH
jgi:glycosyltransferase involved in cell wall biosynthesis